MFSGSDFPSLRHRYRKLFLLSPRKRRFQKATEGKTRRLKAGEQSAARARRNNALETKPLLSPASRSVREPGSKFSPLSFDAHAFGKLALTPFPSELKNVVSTRSSMAICAANSSPGSSCEIIPRNAPETPAQSGPKCRRGIMSKGRQVKTSLWLSGRRQTRAERCNRRAGSFENSSKRRSLECF